MLSSSPYLSVFLSRRSRDLEYEGDGSRMCTTEAGLAGSRLTRVSLKVMGGSGSILVRVWSRRVVDDRELMPTRVASGAVQ